MSRYHQAHEILSADRIPRELLYHGTSDVYLESIKENGLRPRQNLPGHYEGGWQSQSDMVYLTLDDELALNRANEAVAAVGGDPIVITVELQPDDAPGLMPDEDILLETTDITVSQLMGAIESGEDAELKAEIADGHYVGIDIDLADLSWWELSLQITQSLAIKGDLHQDRIVSIR